MSLTVVVIACSWYKNAVPSPARDLYFGSQFRAARRAALVTGHPWMILSAKHGLLRPDEMVDPYDAVMDPTNPALIAKVRGQLQGWTDVVAFTPKPYADLLLRAAPPGTRIKAPMAGLPIGEQRAYLSNVVKRRRIP